MKQFNEKLIDQRLITRSQYEYLHRVNSKEIISVYSEIRTILYLGVLLFTTGIGYFTYQNIGEFGHITLMAFILALILIACFYSFKKVPPYTHDIQVAPNPYFDYVVLFETVLTLSLFTYIHAYFELPRYLVKPTTLLSSVMLFFTAYRFDHRGILNMGLTTLAAFCGLSISPSKLEFENILKDTSLSLTGIVFALSLIGLNYFLSKRKIKTHFTFSYLNYSYLLLFISFFMAYLQSEGNMGYVFLGLVSSMTVAFISKNSNQFLFYLYAMITNYIAVTIMVFYVLSTNSDSWVLGVYYFPISSIAFLVHLVKIKGQFDDK